MTKTKEREGQVVPRVSRSTLAPMDEMDRLFNRMWETGFLTPFEMHWPKWSQFGEFEERVPKVDVIDRKKEILVRAEIPGVTREKLDITLAGEYLTIRGEEHEEKQEEGEFFRSEIRHGSFSRTVHLPSAVIEKRAKAVFKDGVLEITLPKAETVEKHRVEIS